MEEYYVLINTEAEFSNYNDILFRNIVTDDGGVTYKNGYGPGTTEYMDYAVNKNPTPEDARAYCYVDQQVVDVTVNPLTPEDGQAITDLLATQHYTREEMQSMGWFVSPIT